MVAQLAEPVPAMPRPAMAALSAADESRLRAEVVRVAHTWIGTPYRQCGRHKGAGVDCAMLPLGVMVEAGVIEDFDPGPYAPEWHLHQSEERYLTWLLNVACNVAVPQPGDLVLFWYGRCFSHAGILVGDDMMIHAPASDERRGVRLAEMRAGEFTHIDRAGKRPRPRLYFDVFARVRALLAGH
jgi:cell wall-associated NlpC family hydrolase